MKVPSGSHCIFALVLGWSGVSAPLNACADGSAALPAAPVESAAPSWPERVAAWIEATGNDPLPMRVDGATRMFLGSRYLGDPLGEGLSGQYDQDDLYRFDGFDCTTFVETIMALAGASDFEHFERRMNAIRYEAGRIEFTARNHFPSCSPQNYCPGFIAKSG